jgi:MFS family permease
MSQRPGLRQAVAALAYPDYRRFAASLLLTSIGAQLVQTATLWQVYELTGSALLLGLTGIARAVPHMVLSLVGGVIADRVNRVRLIQVGQVLNGLLVLALALLTITGTVEVWHLYVITFLNSSFTAATQPARAALIPSLIGQGNLVNAIALNATIGQTSQIVGPALGGIALGWIDLGPTYLVNAALYLGGMLAIIGIRTPVTPPKAVDSPWRSFVEGLAFVRQRKVIVSLLLLDLAQTVFGSYRALLPIIADGLGTGSTGYGLLSAAPGVGALVGATFILSLGDMRYKGVYTILGVLAYCLALAVMGLTSWFWLAMIAAAFLGTTNSVQMIPRNTVILAISPDALRGRVEAFRSMMAGGGPPLGFAFSGGVAAVVGAPVALVIGAVACAVFVGGIGIVDRELRDPDLGAPPRTPVPWEA